MGTAPSEPPPHDGTRLGKDLYDLEKSDDKVRSAAWDLYKMGDRLRHPEDYAHIETEYCDAFNTKRQGLCDAALDPYGQCPYASEHRE